MISTLICVASGKSPGRILRELYKLAWIYFKRNCLVRGRVFIGYLNMYRDLGEFGQVFFDGVVWSSDPVLIIYTDASYW